GAGRREGQHEAAGGALHLLLRHALGVLEGGVDGGGDEILHHRAVAALEQLRLDLDAQHAQIAAGGGGHQPRAGAALDGAAREVALQRSQLLLHLLRAAHERAEVGGLAHRAGPGGAPPASGRIASTSPPRSSSAALTAGCSSASRWRRRASSGSLWAAAAAPGAAGAVGASTAIRSGVPKISAATASRSAARRSRRRAANGSGTRRCRVRSLRATR